MSLIRSLIERREFSLAAWESWLDGGGSVTSSGAAVTVDSALTWSICWGCVLVKSQDIAKTPLTLYRRLGKNGEDGREVAVGHPVWRLLRRPNSFMTSFSFRQTMQMHVETTGNAYAVIERDARGIPSALWPRDPGYLRAEVKNGALLYRKADSGEYLPARDVFHLKHVSKDGLTGLSPITYFREGIGLALGYTAHASNQFRNQIRPSLIGSTPNINLSPEKAREIGKSITEQNAGVSNSGKVIISYGGIELKPWGFSNKDADYIAASRLTNEDGCRIWRVPPYKVMDYTQSAYANMATASEEYVNDSLRPGQINWEEEIALKLLSEADQDTYYAEHDNDALLKGTPMERAQVENIRLLNGTSQINEVRRSHNWKPVKGGEKNRTQMQMVPIDAPPAPPAEPAKRDTNDVHVHLPKVATRRNVIRDVAGEIVGVEDVVL